MLSMILLVLAVDNVSDMLTNLDLLEWARNILDKVPFFGKIGRCKYCQSFWLLGIAMCPWIAVPSWAIFWLAMHRIVQFVGEFYDRYLNRAPLTIMSITDVSKS